MYCSNTTDCLLQQAGLIQKGDINQGIHDSLLRNAALIQGRHEYRPIWPHWKNNNPLRWATRSLQKLNFRNRQAIKKRIQKDFRPASTIPGN